MEGETNERRGGAVKMRNGVERNKNLVICQTEPFYQTLRKRIALFTAANPDAKLVSLSIGDVSEPIPAVITSAMEKYSRGLSTREGFSGYGTLEGMELLRIKLAERMYHGLGIKASEIFISDGAKGCFSRLQILFGAEATVAFPEPSYPVIVQQSYLFASSSPEKEKVVFMKGNPNKNFFPDLAAAERTDLIYFCSPNNPTGIAASREELTELVRFATRNGSIILYDAVYSAFISDDSPKSIYEIPGAEKVAIEVGSFSKLAGFTGVRLGWVIVPEALCYADGHRVIDDFHRVVVLTFPSGASSVAQAGGLACLTDDGIKETQELIAYYKENARILLDALVSHGLVARGGENSPYIWVEFLGRSSDEVFNEWLEKAHIITSPGSFFGPSGDGFLRISSFGHREDILEAVQRLAKLLPKN